jgi:hypothetical protein
VGFPDNFHDMSLINVHPTSEMLELSWYVNAIVSLLHLLTALAQTLTPAHPASRTNLWFLSVDLIINHSIPQHYKRATPSPWIRQAPQAGRLYCKFAILAWTGVQLILNIFSCEIRKWQLRRILRHVMVNISCTLELKASSD